MQEFSLATISNNIFMLKSGLFERWHSRDMFSHISANIDLFNTAIEALGIGMKYIQS